MPLLAVIGSSMSGAATAREKVGLRWRFPAGWGVDALLARAQAHGSWTLAFQSHHIRLLRLGGRGSAANKADPIPQPFRFFEV